MPDTPEIAALRKQVETLQGQVADLQGRAELAVMRGGSPMATELLTSGLTIADFRDAAPTDEDVDGRFWFHRKASTIDFYVRDRVNGAWRSVTLS